MIDFLNIPRDDAIVLQPPRFEPGKPMLFVGLAARHSFAAPQGIPAQWQEFMASYSEIPDKAQPIPVGISANMDDDGNFDYVCAVEVSKFSDTPRGLIELRVPAQTYAVFLHREHISRISATYAAIWNDWPPERNYVVADGPNLERHLETFDPRTGLGGVEIWIAVKNAG